MALTHRCSGVEFLAICGVVGFLFGIYAISIGQSPQLFAFHNWVIDTGHLYNYSYIFPGFPQFFPQFYCCQGCHNCCYFDCPMTKIYWHIHCPNCHYFPLCPRQTWNLANESGLQDFPLLPTFRLRLPICCFCGSNLIAFSCSIALINYNCNFIIVLLNNCHLLIIICDIINNLGSYISANMLYINRFSKLFPSFKRGCYLFSNENNEGPKQKPKEVKQEDILKELAEKQIKLKSHKIQLKDIILRNYQVPQYPRKYHKLSVFMAEKKKRFFGKTQKQMKEIIQYLEYKKRQKYEKQFRNYNSKQEGRQRAFGRIYSSPILRLPTYHHLIIAFMKLPQYEKWYNNNFHLFKSINTIDGLSQTKIQPQEQTNQNNLISQSESESESQQRQYEEQSLLEQDTDIYKQFPWPPQQAVELSGQQIFQMLEKSHPLARFMACQVYDLIHDRYAQKNKTFKYHTIRLPIIWFKHAYQFYLVEQSKEGMLQTKVEKYKQDYENLSKQQQLKYQSLAQHQVLKYNYYLKKISNRMRVSISKVKTIQKYQYNPYLQRTLLNMTKYSKSY